MKRAARYAWALPATALGLVFVPLALLGRGRARVVNGVLEVTGFVPRWFLRMAFPLAGGASAMTLGHVVLGRDADALERTRAHERVHVTQYELWGPFFIPAYLLSSLALALAGRDAYADNPFERQAERGAI